MIVIIKKIMTKFDQNIHQNAKRMASTFAECRFATCIFQIPPKKSCQILATPCSVSCINQARVQELLGGAKYFNYK